MSSILTGDPSTITTPITRTVTGATNATPIVISTAAVPHEFETFDRVLVSGVGGNTAANGEWEIVKLSATTFELVGSVGSGAYTSGGQVQNNSLTPQFTIPSDGDNLDAASVNVALEALADRTQYLATKLSLHTITVPEAGEWVVPTGVVAAFAIGWGGGGGGAGAGKTSNVSGVTAGSEFGGGGGAGARVVVVPLDLTPGETVSITVGAGGAGGAASSTGGDGGANGSDGGSTIIVTDAATHTFRGGAGGYAFSAGTTTFHTYSNGIATSFGGRGVAGSPVPNSLSIAPSTLGVIAVGSPGDGGFGVDGGAASTAIPTAQRAGLASAEGYLGGAAGAVGTASATRRGGGGGGGGGAGPFGAGGAGGAGGAASEAGNGTAGTAGSAAASNTGAGGGGGGGGGNGGTLAGASGAGGAGGSGLVTILYAGLV